MREKLTILVIVGTRTDEHARSTDPLIAKFHYTDTDTGPTLTRHGHGHGLFCGVNFVH